MIEDFNILFVFYIAANIVFWFAYIDSSIKYGCDKSWFLTRKPVCVRVHEDTKMNWFGCIVSALFFYILLPINIIGCIVRIIYWIFHIGRKDD